MLQHQHLLVSLNRFKMKSIKLIIFFVIAHVDNNYNPCHEAARSQPTGSEAPPQI